MQARTWTKRFEPGQIKIILVAAAAITILLIGAVLSGTLSSSDQAASIDRAQNEIARLMSNARFVELNTLPGDPGTHPVTSLQEYRFFDSNILPGNLGTKQATVSGLWEYRFLELNILPDDDLKFVPPSGEPGTRY